MDDPLSALDANVRKKVFEKLILKELEGKTRIMVTHAVEFLDHADRILVMENGMIIEDGKYSQLIKSKDSKLQQIIESLKAH